VTRVTSKDGSRANWPLQRGLDKYYGTLVGAGNFFNPFGLCRPNTLITHLTASAYQRKEVYYTHALSDYAVTFL
jgi:hypothetical protein